MRIGAQFWSYLLCSNCVYSCFRTFYSHKVFPLFFVILKGHFTQISNYLMHISLLGNLPQPYSKKQEKKNVYKQCPKLVFSPNFESLVDREIRLTERMILCNCVWLSASLQLLKLNGDLCGLVKSLDKVRQSVLSLQRHIPLILMDSTRPQPQLELRARPAAFWEIFADIFEVQEIPAKTLRSLPGAGAGASRGKPAFFIFLSFY